MAVTVKLFTQIVNELIGWMQIHAREIDDYNDGSIVKSELEAIALQLDYSNLQIENAQAAEAILTSTGVDLELKVADYGIKRKDAVKAAGQLQFVLTAPAPITGFTIQAGTIVSTPPSFNPYDAVEFQTTIDLTITSGNTTGAVGATATVAGAASNQPVGAVTVLTTAVSGVQGVINTTAFTGGSDSESDSSLQNRGIAAFVSSANDKAISFQSAVSDVPGILAAAVAGYGDPIMVRDNGNGGKADIYYQGVPNVQQTTETFTFRHLINSGDYSFSPYVYAPPAFNVLRNIPVVSIVSVTNLTTAAIVPPAQYALVLDTSQAFGGSDRAADTLHWFSTAGISDGDQLEVAFTYNAMVGTARAAAETKRGATVDLLVKPGFAVPVNVAITVNAKTQVSIPTVRAALEQTLTTLLATRLLNQDLLQAAVIQKVLQVSNVQNLQVPLDLLSIGLTGVSDIIVNEAQYITPGSIAVNVLPPLTIQ